jgi:hypothetical protein
MTAPAADGQSLTALLRELADGGADLVRQEARLVRSEAMDDARSVALASAGVALGGVTAGIGGLALLAGLVLLVARQWLRDDYALAALLVALVAGGGAAAALWRARHVSLAPTETLASLEEDIRWLKRLRT